MQYLISFLEGMITFISPCLLPMLPIYISYFAGGDERDSRRTIRCTIGFILGFTMMFISMGALAGSLGSFLLKYQTIVNVLCGAVVILFGLQYTGLLQVNVLDKFVSKLFGGRKRSVDTQNMGFVSALVFGVIFSVGWTPCVGTFLGSALMLASTQGQVLTGMLMLLAYSLGLGIPFLLSAVLIDQLKDTFSAFISSPV